MRFVPLLLLVSTTIGDPTPLYRDPKAGVDARVTDLLSRMTIDDKVSQLVQGHIAMWLNTTTNVFNATGLRSYVQSGWTILRWTYYALGMAFERHKGRTGLFAAKYHTVDPSFGSK